MVGQRSRAGRSLGIAAALGAAYLFAAVGIALDRAAPDRPELARWVPSPFRQQAIGTEIAALTQAGRPQATGNLAEALVRRDPLSPHAAGLLGTARLAQGNFGGAASAFRTSAKLGWRDAATQIYWLQAAMAAGDFSRAGWRFGALARQWPDAPAIDQLSAQFESDPRGQATLAQQIAGGAKWAASYATPRAGEPLDRIAGRAEVLIAAGALGTKLGCDSVAAMVGTLTGAQADLAARLWASHCPRAVGPGQIADGGFEAQEGLTRSTSFDWQFPGDGALAADVTTKAVGGHALRLSSSAASLLPVAIQRVVLAPGTYRVSWEETGSGPARMAASLSCRADRSLAQPQRGQRNGSRAGAELRHDGSCPAVLLQLWLAPGAGEVQVDDVRIDRR